MADKITREQRDGGEESWDSGLKSPSKRASTVRVHLRSLPAQAAEPAVLFWFFHDTP